MTPDDFDELELDNVDAPPQLIPFTTSFSRPQRTARTLNSCERSALNDLLTNHVRPAVTIGNRLLPAEMARLVQEKRIFLQRSAIGPIASPGYPGPAFKEPFHRSPNALADLLYLRLAVQYSQSQGYQPVRRMGHLGYHLVNQEGVPHVLVARISAGPISPPAISRLLREWRHDFVVTRGHLIVASTQPHLYRRLRNHRHRLEVWHFDPAAAWRHLEQQDGFWCE